MANAVYDPETEGEQGYHPPNLDPLDNKPAGRASDPRDEVPSGDASDPRGEGPDSLNQDELQDAEESAGAGGGLYNPKGDSKQSSAGDLRGAEQSRDSSGSSVNPNQESLFNPDGDEPKGRFGQARAKARNAQNRYQNLKRRAMSNKLFIGVGLGGSSTIAIIIIALVLLGGSLKIVDFSEHVAAYQFARVTRQMSSTTERITAEKIGMGLIGEDRYAAVKGTYEGARGKVKETWSKLDKYRPNKIISNYAAGEEPRMKFNYRTGRFGQQILQSVTLNGKTADITRGSLKTLIPGYQLKADARFSKKFAPELIASLKADDIGPITRAKVASEIRQRLGISLVAWSIGKFGSKSEIKNRVEVLRQSKAAAEGKQLTLFDDAQGNPVQAAKDNPGEVATGSAENIDDVAKKAKEAEQVALFDDTQAEAIVKNPNEMPTGVQNVIDEAIAEQTATSAMSIVKRVLGVINPVYGVATPVCLIYEGSIQKSGPSIELQSEQAQRSAIWLHAASAQLKDGRKASPEAAGATAWKLDDITKSNAEIRASGIFASTSNYASTQASPTGQYSYSLSDFLPKPLDSITEHLSGACPAFTNIWVGIGLGAANIGLSLITGGGAAEADAAVAGAAEAAVDQVVPSLATRIISRTIQAGSKTKEFAKSTGKQVAVIGGLTLIAKALVISHMGSTHSAMATGKPFDDMVDDGTNQYAQQIGQQQFYGAPLRDVDLSGSFLEDRQFLGAAEARKSPFERYLAVSNPNSLLSRSAIMVNGHTNGSLPNSIMRLGDSLLSPFHAVGSVLTSAISGTTFAQEPITSNNFYYGNVQFGDTKQEQHLLKTDVTYRPLKNQEILDLSGKEQQIDDLYHSCFDGSKNIGELLADGDIRRDKNGDIKPNEGLCSPNNLGLNNHDFGDLVFRYRIAHRYNNVIDQLLGEQEVTKNVFTSPIPGTEDTSSTSTGNAQELAKQVLQNSNINLSVGRLVKEDVEAASRDENGSAGVKTSSAIFKLLLEIAKHHSVVVVAIQSGGTGHCHNTPKAGCPNDPHYTGDGVDLGTLDGKLMTGRDSGSLAVIKTAGRVLPSGSGVGQSQCGATPDLPSNLSTFPDSCNHLHLQVPKGTP